MMPRSGGIRRHAPTFLSALVLAATLVASALVLLANRLAQNPNGVRLANLATDPGVSKSGDHFVKVDLPSLKGKSKSIYFSGLQGPVALYVGDRQIAEFGSRATGMAPRSQDAIFQLPEDLSHAQLTIAWGQSPLGMRGIGASGSAVLVDTTAGQMLKFAKEFVSSYSFIGIGTTLTLLGLLILLFSAMDRTAARPTWVFGIALIGQGMVSLYFSRIFFEVPHLSQVALHIPAFLTYLASSAAYFWYFATEPSRLSTTLKAWIIMPLCGILGVLIALVGYGFPGAVSAYKYALIATLPGWYLTASAVIMFRKRAASAYGEAGFVAMSLAASSILVALAQTNDVFRVFTITIFPYNIGPLVFFFCAVLVTVNLAIEFSVRQRNVISNERKIALSEMVSAISHDVRKPLSMAKILMTSIQEMNSPEDIRQFAIAAVPDIQKAIDSVEGLLQDVMQVGAAQVSLQREDVSPEWIVDSVLDQIFRGHPDADVTVQCTSEPDLLLCVDVSKASRIYANIIANACQAMNWSGSIEIRARRQKDRVVFQIRNEGSHIPSENLGHLFDLFFTSNKRGGTGLGLAIAKKWTEAHGGKISCRSQLDAEFPRGMVEFTFDLPRSFAAGDCARPAVRGHSSEYKLMLGVEDALSATGETRARLDQIKEALEYNASTLRIIHLDNEETYLVGVKATLGTLKLHPYLHLESYLSEPANGLPDGDLFLVDHDLERTDRNGSDVIRSLRSHYGAAFVCLHTNRTDGGTIRNALEAGADAVYPKPLSADHLLKLLGHAMERRREHLRQIDTKVRDTQPTRCTRVAYIDDMLVMRLTWKRTLGGLVELSLFDSPESFFASDSTFDIVVTDLHFDNSQLSGKDVAHWVTSKMPDVRLFLCSNDDSVDPSLFKDRIPKDVLPTLELIGLANTRKL